ncbi:unnamed protein product [Ceratitis capitata]|uniref:(Mediterranean fruit fly) hypothetical protein n=1 Tax=Ceratitis capitata TaxID=7213 RepID=A0A811VGH3_CERCA|nr:unnamed protein product [Ceratitis capitata]
MTVIGREFVDKSWGRTTETGTFDEQLSHHIDLDKPYDLTLPSASNSSKSDVTFLNENSYQAFTTYFKAITS